jgi:hypothetical protein
VALRRYRLAFGTPNVYFDFAGGDILYFGPECTDGRILDPEWKWWRRWINLPFGERPTAMAWWSEAVVRDLESVRHLALAREVWTNPRENWALFTYKFSAYDHAHGDLLRNRLRKFKGVEKVFLEHGFERRNNPQQVHEVWMGELAIEDPWWEERPIDWRTSRVERYPLNLTRYRELFPEIDEWLAMDGKWELTGDLKAVALMSRWDMKGLSEEEMEKGVVQARLVDIKFVVDQPSRVREEFWRHQGEVDL